MLGHASAAMTVDIYADLFDHDLDDISTRLDQAALSSVVGEAQLGDDETPEITEISEV